MPRYTDGGLKTPRDAHKAQLTLDAIEQIDRFMDDYDAFLDYETRRGLYDLLQDIRESLEVAESLRKDGEAGAY